MKSLHYNTLGCDEMVSYFEGKLAHDFVILRDVYISIH